MKHLLDSFNVPPLVTPLYVSTFVRLELKAEQENREALRKGEVPPYFESQWGKSFLAAQAAASLINPDMEMLSKKLAEGSKQGTQPPSNSLPSTPGNTPAPTQGEVIPFNMLCDCFVVYTN